MTDTELLNFQAMRRVELTPEFEGPWDAKVYGEADLPEAIFTGNTPREALSKAAAAYISPPSRAIPHESSTGAEGGKDGS